MYRRESATTRTPRGRDPEGPEGRSSQTSRVPQRGGGLVRVPGVWTARRGQGVAGGAWLASCWRRLAPCSSRWWCCCGGRRRRTARPAAGAGGGRGGGGSDRADGRKSQLRFNRTGRGWLEACDRCSRGLAGWTLSQSSPAAAGHTHASCQTSAQGRDASQVIHTHHDRPAAHVSRTATRAAVMRCWAIVMRMDDLRQQQMSGVQGLRCEMYAGWASNAPHAYACMRLLPSQRTRGAP
jgi:hypothetical protein